MGLFSFKKALDIDMGVEEFLQTPGALLLDVRNPDEYWEGHIPGSVNVPLAYIEEVSGLTESDDTRMCVYCRSGARSRQATAALQNMGYNNVKNIGGILEFSGKVER